MLSISGKQNMNNMYLLYASVEGIIGVHRLPLDHIEGRVILLMKYDFLYWRSWSENLVGRLIQQFSQKKQSLQKTNGLKYNRLSH